MYSKAVDQLVFSKLEINLLFVGYIDIYTPAHHFNEYSLNDYMFASELSVTRVQHGYWLSPV